MPERNARQNLSRLLVYLTQATGLHNLLRIDEIQVQLESDLVWVDVRAFEDQWEIWKQTRQLDVLESALQLYRGSFLNGFSLPGNAEYHSWIQEQTEIQEQAYLKALSISIEGATQRNDTLGAIEYAKKYLTYNNLAEDIHCRLIELYASSGDRGAAIRQYETCATILERELGVRPAPETQAAYQAVVKRQPAANEPLLPSPAWTILPSLQLPFVGRHEAIQALEAALVRASSNRGEFILISGESGIGKSRLMQEFTRRPRLRTRLLIGTAVSECGLIPYQPLIEAIRPALGVPSLLAQVPKIWLAEAARILPELVEMSPLTPAPTPISTSEAHTRLFEALFRILIGLTEGGYTLIFCLDDLHWSDATTLDFLAYLGRRISNQRMLLIGSYCSEDVEVLVELRRSLARQPNFSEIALSGLTSQEVNRLFDYLDRSLQLDQNQADQMGLATGGNPFFLLEILRVLMEVAPSSENRLLSEHYPLPTTVRVAVNARIERLRGQVQQILEAAAVLGVEFSPEALHLTSGRQELEILDGLDELVARHFLVEQATGYRFLHTIIQEAVYARLGIWRKKKLHQRAGQALEIMNSDDCQMLCWHFEQAGEPGKAVGYALQAGKAARDVFAHAEARANFDRALALLEMDAANLKDVELINANQRLRIQVLSERGWALRLLGQMEDYTKDLEEMARLAQTLGDIHILANLCWREAYNHRWFCRYKAAQEAAMQGLIYNSEIADPFLEALCRREVGMAARETGDYILAQSALEQALALFLQKTDEIVYTIHTYGNLSILYCSWGEPERARALAMQALELCEQHKLRYERRLPLGDVGVAAATLGDFDAARDYLLESLSIAREIADRTQEIFCQGHLGWLQILRRSFVSALTFFKDAINQTEQVGSLTEQSWLQAGLAETHAGLGDFNQALVHARRALEIAESCGRIPDQRRAKNIIARVQLEISKSR